MCLVNPPRFAARPTVGEHKRSPRSSEEIGQRWGPPRPPWLPSCHRRRGRARRCLPWSRRRARTDWRMGGPGPTRQRRAQGTCPAGSFPAVLGAGAVAWGGYQDGSSPCRRRGRGEGSRYQHLRGGRRQRPVYASGGRRVAGAAARRSRARAEESDEKLREDGARVPSPLLGPRRRGQPSPASRCSRTWAEGTGGPGAPGAAAEGLRREQGLRPGRTEPRSPRARSTKGKERLSGAPSRGSLRSSAHYQKQRRGETGLKEER